MLGWHLGFDDVSACGVSLIIETLHISQRSSPRSNAGGRSCLMNEEKLLLLSQFIAVFRRRDLLVFSWLQAQKAQQVSQHQSKYLA